MLRNLLSVGILHPDGDHAVAKSGQGPEPHMDAPWSKWASNSSLVLALVWLATMAWLVRPGADPQIVRLLALMLFCLPVVGAALGLLSSIKPGPGRNTGLAGIALNIMFLMIMAAPNYMSWGSKSKLSAAKANMHALQLGVEQYAGDNHGKYPDSVRDNDFDWAKYMPGNLRNPFKHTVSGRSNMEPDVRTAMRGTAPIYTVAQTYTGKGTPGNMRYFVDTHSRSTYAIIGYDKDGNIIKETAEANARNYVLHN